jgi:hypothetical protein
LSWLKADDGLDRFVGALLVEHATALPSRFDVACHKAGSVMEGHLDGRADVALSKSMTAFNIRSDEAVVTRFGVLDL